MKHKLLLLCAAAMMGIGAQAQDFTLDRQLPAAPEFTSFAANDTIYLYNIGGGGFYTNHRGASSSPYWGTRATANDTIGSKVIFTRTNPTSTLDTQEDWTNATTEGLVLDNTYLLVSYVTSKGEYRCTFADGQASIWTDNNANAYRYFNVVQDGNYIKIERNLSLDQTRASAELTGTTSEGHWLGTDADGIVFLDTLGTGVEYNVQWGCVTPTVYDAWMATNKEACKVYMASQSLKKAIQDAYTNNTGITLPEQLAVYNNASATVEELEAAEATIPQAIIDYRLSQASVENPADVSSAITNGTLDSWSSNTAKNWSGTGFTRAQDSATSAEKYGEPFDTYQDVKGLKPGVYMMTVNAFTRKTNVATDWEAYINGELPETKIYVESATYGRFSQTIKHIVEGASEVSISSNVESETEVTDKDGETKTIYTPDRMLSAQDYFTTPIDNGDGTTTPRYQNTVYGIVAEGDTLRIGAYSVNAGSADWSIFDDFQLYYLGTSDAAYEVVKEAALKNNVFTPVADTYYSQKELDAYTTAYAALQSATGTAIAESIEPVTAAIDSVVASYTYYKEYTELIAKVVNWRDTEELITTIPAVAKMNDYIEAASSAEVDYNYPHGVYQEIILEGEYGGTLSNLDIMAEIDSVTVWYTEAIRNNLHEGGDLTNLLVNPDFELSGGQGWSLDTSNGGTSTLTNWYGGTPTNHGAEAFDQDFDVYQIVTGLPEGIYSVSVQAFYRTAANAIAYTAYTDQTEDATVYAEVYFNDFASKVRNVFEIGFDENLGGNCVQQADGKYYLNGMTSALTAFSLPDEDQNFTMRAYGVVTDGTMRLGIRKIEGPQTDSRWTLWDNFKLTYEGKNVEVMDEVMNDLIAQATAYKDSVMGAPDIDALTTLLTAADDAQSSGDADEMFTALVALNKGLADAKAACASYRTMQSQLDKLTTAVETYADASDEAMATAQELLDELSDAMSTYELSGAELESKYSSQVDDAIKALKADPSASDENPKDFTNEIVNPDFSENTTTGWDTTGSSSFDVGSGTAEKYNTDIPGFNTYQDITALPAGTYLVKVKGIHRDGYPTNDYESWTDAKEKAAADPAYVDSTITTYLYARTAEGYASTPLKHVCEGGLAANDYSNVNAADGSGDAALYVPNSMAEAASYFSMYDGVEGQTSPYEVELYVTVGEDGVLRIGITNTASSVTSGSWVIVDDFELWYLGTESSHAQDADKGAVRIDNVDSSAEVIGSVVYNLSGARVNGLQKGINIVKQQMADGSVKVLKVFKK